LANTDVSPSTVKLSSCTSDQQESEASQTEASPLLPLKVAQAEQTKVKEHEADMLETGPLVAVDIVEESIPALHQNIQANTDVSPSTVKLSSCTSDQQESEATASPGKENSSSTVKLSLCTTDQQESEATAAPGEGSPSQTNVTKMEVEPPEVIEHEGSHTKAKMEVEPPEVIGHEACVPQACSVSAAMDNAKENIPALQQDIQPSGAPPSPLKGNILASHENIQATVAMTPVKGSISPSHHLNMQAIGDMTPVTLLTQKLSTISLGASNGEATPLTLLAQKLSSVSLGDATD